MTQDAAFNDFDETLNLDPAERSEAREFHNGITDFLKQEGLISGAFLQGSFARKTMLSPIRDIDKVVILSSSLRHLLTEPNGAQAVVAMLEEALRRKYPDAKFSRARHAIQMDLGEDTFSFDVVPAFETEDASDDVLIMDLGKSTLESNWKLSNTRTLMRVVAERNGACGGAFIHQVRHAKEFARVKLGKRLPGLHVESIAYTCITEKLSYPAAAAQILACGAQLLLPGQGYDEPTGLERLSEKLDAGDRLVAQQAFAQAAAQAERALALSEEGDDDAAVAIWHDIFGDLFPTPPTRQNEFLTGLYAGHSVSRSTPPARPTRAWRPW